MFLLYTLRHSPITLVRPPGKEGVVVLLSELIVGLHHDVPHGDAHRHHKEGELVDPIRESHNGEGDSATSEPFSLASSLTTVSRTSIFSSIRIKATLRCMSTS